MKIHLIIVVALTMILSCNGAKFARTFKDPLKKRENNISSIYRDVTFSENPNSFSVIFWSKNYDWESDLYNISDSYESKRAIVTEIVTKYKDMHDDVDRELYLVNKKLFVWDDNLCEMYNIDDEDIPGECKGIWEEGPLLMDLQDKLNIKKSEYIDEIVSAVDEKDNRRFWKIDIDDKTHSVFKFNEDRSLVKNIEVNYWGSERINYTLKNGGIKNIEVDTFKRLFFTLHEKDQLGKSTGNIYQFRLYQIYFLDRIRYVGKINLVDSNLNLIEERVGSCSIEFEPEE